MALKNLEGVVIHSVRDDKLAVLVFGLSAFKGCCELQNRAGRTDVYHFVIITVILQRKAIVNSLDHGAECVIDGVSERSSSEGLG